MATLLGYTISKLSVRFPSRGGLVSFLARGFGDSHVTGIASWLFYLAGMIVTAMVALSFGGYARELFLPDRRECESGRRCSQSSWSSPWLW